MRTNGVSNVSFQAHIPKAMYTKMLDEVCIKHTVTPDAFLRQVENVKSWGYENSVLSEVLGTQSVFKGLNLVNSYLAPLRKAALPAKDTLLSSFMALTKKDIVSAQDVLKI